MNKKNRISLKYSFMLLFMVICFGYLIMQSARGAYESNIDVQANSTMAGWSIKINNTQVTGQDIDELDLNYVVTENGIGANNKAAPGSILEYPVVLDPVGTDVAIRVDLDIIDKSVDSDKFLELKEVSSTDLTIVRTSISTYTAIIPKNKLNGTSQIKLKLEWPDDGSLVEYVEDTSDEDYFSIDFHAVQYRGETITPYS